MANLYNIVSILFVLYAYIPGNSADYDFCNYNCKYEQHIRCFRKDVNCSQNPERCTSPEMEYFSLESRQILLDAYNQVRNEVALGEFGYPKAANMKAMRWCFELEYIAQCLTNQCDFSVNYYCLATRNYFVRRIQFAPEDSFDPHNYTWAYNFFKYYFKAEGAEVKNPEDFDKNPAPKQPVFDRLVCSQLNAMGCGHLKYTDLDNYRGHFIVCCWSGPPKPFLACERDTPLYIRGEPCTRCEASACNRKYPGLCGITIPVNDEIGVRFRADDIASSVTTVVNRHGGAVICIILVPFAIIYVNYVYML